MEPKRKQTRPKRGRPPLPAGEGKRFPLNMRTTKAIRDKLQAAAQQSGRSLAQEVEFRLERSFADEETRYREFGGAHRYGLMRWLARTLEVAESITDKPVATDRETFRIAMHAMGTMLESLTPQSGGLPDEASEDIGRGVGETFVKLVAKSRKKAKAKSRKKAKKE